MNTYHLNSLARLREEGLRRVARRAYRLEQLGLEVTDVPASHRRWRVHWDPPRRRAAAA